jgi:hypothetical protein
VGVLLTRDRDVVSFEGLRKDQSHLVGAAEERPEEKTVAGASASSTAREWFMGDIAQFF